MPLWYNIEVSSHCNLKCPYCPTGNGTIPMAHRGNITTENFNHIFNQIRPFAQVIQFFNWGEPFMHKNIYDFIETAHGAGIRTMISSNMTVRLFDEAELERLVNSGLTSLLASIDGVKQEAYEAYRKNGDVSKALTNLENIEKTKKRLGSATPHLIWAYYVNRHNEEQVPAARRRAEKMGVPIWFKELSCPDDFQTHLIKTVPQLFAPPENLAAKWPTRHNPDLGKVTLDPRLPQVCNVCTMPFEIMIINYNGDVFPCTAVTEKHMVVGNLLNQSVEEIWGARMAANRIQLLDTGTPVSASQCKDCRHFKRIALNQIQRKPVLAGV